MIGYLSNCQIRLNIHKVWSCFGCSGGVGSGNLPKSPVMSRFYLSGHNGPPLLLQLHRVTSCARNMKLPSWLHRRLHSWVSYPLSVPQSYLAFQVQPKCTVSMKPSLIPKLELISFPPLCYRFCNAGPSHLVLQLLQESSAPPIQDTTDTFRVTFYTPQHLVQQYMENSK